MDDNTLITCTGHPHTLMLKEAKRPYYCWGCDQLGFGLSYVCSIDDKCDFFLHEQCGKTKSYIEYPFSKSKKCFLRFREEGSGLNSPCDACGKKIKKFHYRCMCTSKRRNLHPACLVYEETLQAADGLKLNLVESATSKCLHCGTKGRWPKVHGWAYVSENGTYCYHVSCVKEVINKNWQFGFFTGKSDPYRTIKQKFLEDVERRNQVVVAPKREQPTMRHAKAILSIIFNVLTGNPIGLIGVAQSIFR